MTQLDKKRVALSFSNAASSYDKAAGFQRDVGHRLLQMLQKTSVQPRRLLDLGCGTGFFTRKLKQYYSDTEVIGLDLAQGMLLHAKAHSEEQHITWLCADAESLSLKSQSIDVLFSNLAIQWCENLPALFAEIDRVLAPGGMAFITTLGPRSLYELKQAWASVDKKSHVNKFATLASISSAVPSKLIHTMEQQAWVLEYNKLQELTADLKNIGAQNMNKNEQKGLTGRNKVHAFKQNYEKYRQENGKLPASYEVFFLQLKKPVNSLTERP